MPRHAGATTLFPEEPETQPAADRRAACRSSRGGALNAIAQTEGQARVSLDAAACLAIGRPGGACTACAGTCPVGAIGIEVRAVTIDHDACTGCGRCAPACPTGALSLDGFLPVIETGNQEGAYDAAVFECARVAPADRVAGATPVPCLGGLTQGHLHHACEVAGHVELVDRGWCADCPSGGSAEPWRWTVAQVARDRALIDPSPEGPVARRLPLDARRAGPAPQPRRPAQPALSRRQLFARLTTAPAAPECSRIAPAHPGSGKVSTPALRTRLESLVALSPEGEVPAAAFPALQVTGATDMRLAAALCPTEALSLCEDEDADRLIFDAAACLACGACLPAGGLELQDAGTGPGEAYDGPQILIERTMAACPQCLRRHAPGAGQRVCDACIKDSDLAALGHGLMRRRQVPYGA